MEITLSYRNWLDQCGVKEFGVRDLAQVVVPIILLFYRCLFTCKEIFERSIVFARRNTGHKIPASCTSCNKRSIEGLSSSCDKHPNGSLPLRRLISGGWIWEWGSCCRHVNATERIVKEPIRTHACMSPRVSCKCVLIARRLQSWSNICAVRMFKNLFMLSVRISLNGCTREVWRPRKMLKSCTRR